jgi:hypothetical protein
MSEDIISILRNVRDAPKLYLDKDYEGNHSKKKPRLVFRAFETSHNFRARQFLDTDRDIPTPPAFGSNAFRTLAEPHLRGDLSYQSPFISVTEWPRYAMKVMGSMKPARSLAVFDMLDIEEDSTERFGERCRPYPVGTLCKKHDLFDLPGGYTGRGEVSYVQLMMCLLLTNTVASMGKY